jgi:hypothetical protein
MSEWTEDLGELVALAGALVDADWLDTPRDVVDFFEKPWKWSDCREAWQASGRPGCDDAGWEMFGARLRRLE